MIVPAEPATGRDVAHHYDELDPFYRRLWGEHLHHGLFTHRGEDPQRAAARMVTQVAELAGIRPGHRVCDVGCGYGATARELALRYGAEVVGITLSRAQLRYARERAPPGAALSFRQMDWLDNDFPDDAFDAVLAVECVSHMTDKGRFFREAARTLRPGGYLVVCAWLAREGAGFLRRRLLLEPICRAGRLPAMGTEADYRQLLADAELSLETLMDLTRRVKRTWSVSVRRLLGTVLRDPEARRRLRDPAFSSRSFAGAVLRIWMAYEVGAMRYGVFLARRR